MRFRSLEPSPNRGDRLIEGHSITLDGQLFRIFVMEELTAPQRGYILKLMFGWGNDTGVNLDKQSTLFPQTTRIFESYLPDAWENRGRDYFCYKYIVFGHGDFNREIALTLMHHILEEVGEGGER